jgi:ankyrin repeat protein
MASVIAKYTSYQKIKSKLNPLIDTNQITEIQSLLSEESPPLFVEGALCRAAKNGNIRLIRLFIENGATNLNGAMVSAASKNRLEAVKYLIEQGASNIKYGIEEACRHGSLETMKYLLSRYSKPNDFFIAAVEFNQERIVDHYVSTPGFVSSNLGLINLGLIRASILGYDTMVRKLIQSGATNLNECLRYVCRKKQLAVAKVLVAHGAAVTADNIEDALITKDWEMARYLLTFVLNKLKYKHDERNYIKQRFDQWTQVADLLE